MIEKLENNIYCVSENNFPQNSEELFNALKKMLPRDLIIVLPKPNYWSPHLLEPLVNYQQRQKKTLVWVLSTRYSNLLPSEWPTVPTMQEALDYIQFEQMQRDLGF